VNDDGMMKLLAALPRVGGDERRARRVQSKCRSELERQTRGDAAVSHLFHAVLALLGAAYLAQLARLAAAVVR
jgi:hypothetical protein